MTVQSGSRWRISLFLMALVVLAGGGSAVLAYWFGRESLRGVTQPVVNPILGDTTAASGESERPTFLKEADILAQVKKLTNPQTAPSPTPMAMDSPAADPPTDSASPKPEVAELPQSVTSQGIKLEVTGIMREGADLVLQVSLTNGSAASTQFLYTFLDVKSDQGTSLRAITTGLPTELPAESDTFSGKIQIPLADIEDVESLDLTLVNYPNEDVTLSLQDIPVQP